MITFKVPVSTSPIDTDDFIKKYNITLSHNYDEVTDFLVQEFKETTPFLSPFTTEEIGDMVFNTNGYDVESSRIYEWIGEIFCQLREERSDMIEEGRRIFEERFSNVPYEIQLRSESNEIDDWDYFSFTLNENMFKVNEYPTSFYEMLQPHMGKKFSISHVVLTNEDDDVFNELWVLISDEEGNVLPEVFGLMELDENIQG